MNHTNKENYNRSFSKEELTRTIQATKKNSTPGPDKIHNEMLKHHPPERLDSLFALYYKIWQQGYFSEKTLESTVIPISKPGKYPTNPSKYKPNAIKSDQCRVKKGMVNVSLLDLFAWKGTPSTLQCRDRAERKTIDNFLSLEATVRTTQANSEQIVSIFFDMEKSYDLTWRHGILLDLSKAGIEVRMLNFMQNFPKHRSFKVKDNEILSDAKFHTGGIP